MSDRDIDLTRLLEAARTSFGEAQGDLLPDGVMPTMMLSEAELQVKAGMKLQKGLLSIEPVSVAELSKSSIKPDALSTVTIRYVAGRPEGAGQTSTRSVDDVVKEVEERKDVSDLAGILGNLKVSARYIPDLEIWTATVVDDRQRIVRTVNIPDRIQT
jgi:hypothetical protein